MSRKKILLAEDNQDQQELIQTVFRQNEAEYEFDEAMTGTEALEKLDRNRYDLVLLDYLMPGCNGIVVLEKIRQKDKDLPVVFMTAVNNPQVTVRAMKLGLADYVIKEGAFQLMLPDVVRGAFERQALKENLLKAQEESQFHAAKLSNLGKILSEVLHEVRNPLSIISTSLQTIRDAQDQGKALKVTLDLMLRNVERARSIIVNLLDFSRPTHYKFEKGDLLDVVKELMGHVQLKCRSEQITLALEAPRSLPEIDMDPRHIKGALLNLLMNAIEAMPYGGNLTVRASEEPEKEGVRLEVEDTGLGIRPDDQKRLFERYFTTKQQGTGLGLMITHQVVTQHQGSIEFRSVQSKGTTFTIRLPRTHRDDGS